MQGVVASSTVLKYLRKVKLTNTLQHIQVYKFQENQMSKSSTKLWKAYIHFPYDLMKLHTFEKLLSFSINLFARQLYPPQKLTSRIQFPWFPIKLCMHDLPSAKAGVQSDARMPGVHMPHCARIFPKEECRHPGMLGAIRASPLHHSHPYVCLHKPSHAQNSYSKRSLWILKWHKDQGKAHVRSSVQAAAATFSNLDWKTKRKMRNRSLNSRLAVMFLTNR